MALFIGDISALHFWRAQTRPLSSDASKQANFERIPAPTSKEIASMSLGLRTMLGREIHLYVGRDSRRRAVAGTQMHVLSKEAASLWFEQVSPGLFVASPELCFAQMGERLSGLQLAKWGMELCGYYRYDESLCKFRKRSAPLSSRESIERFLDLYTGEPGARRAKRIARWMMDGSASLRESQLALHYRIPRRAGGNGIGVPELNYKIDFDEATQRRAGKAFYRVDQYWPGYSLALEYESDEFHKTLEQIADDRKRRNIIQDLGVRVITVNSHQLTNLVEADDIAGQVLRHMHKRQRPMGPEWEQKHREFHSELLKVDSVLKL